MARRGRILRYFTYALLVVAAALAVYVREPDVPVPIGGICPAGNEDRVLVRLSEVPKHLVDELIATEDRKFYTHVGFDPRALVRAAASIATGRLQGGSTITQQLVKNFFLTPERTLRRKFTELVMAILL